MSDLAIVEQDVLSLSADAEPERLLQLLDTVKAAKERLAEIEKQLKETGIRIVQRTGPIPSGDMLWVVNFRKQNKCHGVKPVLSLLLEATGGDLDRVADALASDAWKHGTVKRTLEEFGRGEQYGNHFETVEVPKLELQAINTKFIKSKAVAHAIE